MNHHNLVLHYVQVLKLVHSSNLFHLVLEHHLPVVSLHLRVIIIIRPVPSRRVERIKRVSGVRALVGDKRSWNVVSERIIREHLGNRRHNILRYVHIENRE